jgi:DNA-binding GntR family transcriptional regulator
MTQFEDAVEKLRAGILSGQLAPGEKLGAEELAAEFGMSRTPVREAFRTLASEGLVDLSENRGARVREWSDDELDSLFETRESLEGMAVRRAAQRITPAECDYLHELAVQIAELAEPGPRQDLAEVQRLNGEFHSGIIAIAGSSSLSTAMTGIVHAAILGRTQESYDVEAQRRSSNHHLEIVAALRLGDGPWAESTMRSHLLSARASLLGPRRDISQPPDEIPGS